MEGTICKKKISPFQSLHACNLDVTDGLGPKFSTHYIYWEYLLDTTRLDQRLSLSHIFEIMLKKEARFRRPFTICYSIHAFNCTLKKSLQ